MEESSDVAEMPSSSAGAYDYESFRQRTLLYLATGLLPSVFGLTLILFSLLAPLSPVAVPGLVVGAAMSMAMPVVAVVDSLTRARLETERIRLESKRVDRQIARSEAAIDVARTDIRALALE